MAARTKSADLLNNIMKAARDKYETDTKLETERGIDVDVKDVGTFTLLRAHARNQKFIQAYRKTVVPYVDSAEAKAKKQDEADQKLEDLNRQVFCDTIIIGLKDIAGNVVPYDDAAKQAVCDMLKDAPDLYALLQSDAVEGNNFRKKHEAEEKN